jgi:hypothetical protein
MKRRRDVSKSMLTPGLQSEIRNDQSLLRQLTEASSDDYEEID